MNRIAVIASLVAFALAFVIFANWSNIDGDLVEQMSEESFPSADRALPL